jgi:hypothetical protein
MKRAVVYRDSKERIWVFYKTRVRRGRLNLESFGNGFYSDGRTSVMTDGMVVAITEFGVKHWPLTPQEFRHPLLRYAAAGCWTHAMARAAAHLDASEHGETLLSLAVLWQDLRIVQQLLALGAHGGERVMRLAARHLPEALRPLCRVSRLDAHFVTQLLCELGEQHLALNPAWDRFDLARALGWATFRNCQRAMRTLICGGALLVGDHPLTLEARQRLAAYKQSCLALAYALRRRRVCRDVRGLLGRLAWRVRWQYISF